MGVHISILPHNSATLLFQVLMRMQTDACLKKEQIGTLFVWLGALEGGCGGGGGALRGAQKVNVSSKTN